VLVLVAGIGRFAIQFVLLLSRSLKRRPGFLAALGSWLLAMHLLEVYRLVLPAVDPSGVSVSWVDFAAVLMLGGFALAVACRRARREPTLPLGDPYLARALHYVEPSPQVLSLHLSFSTTSARQCVPRFLFTTRLVANGVVTAEEQFRRIPGILMHPLTLSSVELALGSGRLASTTEGGRMLQDRADRPDRSQASLTRQRNEPGPLMNGLGRSV